MKDLASIVHEFRRTTAIDITTFFGRLEVLEYFCEKTHEEKGMRWRKFGRYGNIVDILAFEEAIKRIKKETALTKKEMFELQEWLKGQAEIYGNPDQAVAGVMMDIFIKKYWV